MQDTLEEWEQRGGPLKLPEAVLKTLLGACSLSPLNIRNPLGGWSGLSVPGFKWAAA